MRLLQLIVLSFILGMVGLAGCVTKPQPRVLETIPPPPPISTQLPQRTDTDVMIPWISEEPTFVVVDKGCGTVNLYQYGRLTKTYPAVFGRSPGKKAHEGDKRTPLGLYMIIDKNRHSRWSRFMRIDYPNGHDRMQYQKNLEIGQIPKKNGVYPGLGGAIGIHGTNHEALNRANINWTLGCISMLNEDVRELYGLVSVGTLVYIKN